MCGAKEDTSKHQITGAKAREASTLHSTRQLSQAGSGRGGPPRKSTPVGGPARSRAHQLVVQQVQSLRKHPGIYQPPVEKEKRKSDGVMSNPILIIFSRGLTTHSTGFFTHTPQNGQAVMLPYPNGEEVTGRLKSFLRDTNSSMNYGTAPTWGISNIGSQSGEGIQVPLGSKQIYAHHRDTCLWEKDFLEAMGRSRRNTGFIPTALPQLSCSVACL